MTKITSKDYDDRIIKQGLQFQIDNYYEPKDAAMQMRTKAVAAAIGAGRGERILDIGCGVGTFAYRCVRSGASAVGIDYSFESVKAAGILCSKYGVGNNAKFLVANAALLPFKNAYFDKVVAADFIEHITSEDKERMLGEVRRVLKPGGRAVIFTPNGTRERIGEICWKIRSMLFGATVPTTELHFGLTTKNRFEELCRKAGFSFRAFYEDTTRPYLARIPLARNLLALNLLWVLRKEA